MNTPKRLALLSSGPPISLKVLYCLHGMGIDTHVIDIRHDSIAHLSRYHSGYLKIVPPIEKHDGERLGEILSDYMIKHHLDGVIAGDIYSSGMLHQARKNIHRGVIFPVSNLDVLDMLDDKWRFHLFMQQHGIPGPLTVRIERPEDLTAIAEQGLSFPLIVKTIYGESGRGVFRADTAAELEQYIASGSKYAQLPLLIQEFATGYDADLSVLAVDGRVIAHVLQSRQIEDTLGFFQDERVLEIGRKIVAASNYSGVANIDVRIDDARDRVTVLECNPRFWYTLQASFWRGANFIEAGFAAASGAPVDWQTPQDGVYHLHGKLIKRLLWNPVRWSQIPGYNLRGLCQALSDPRPFLQSG